MNGTSSVGKCALYENIQDKLIVIYLLELLQWYGHPRIRLIVLQFECEHARNKCTLEELLPERPVGTKSHK